MKAKVLPETSSPSRRQVLEDLRTQEILAAARRVLAAKGLAAATMEEVAETAGIAKGTIYLYFRNKQVLFQAVLKDILESLVAGIEQLARRPDSAEKRLAAILHLLLATLEAEEACFRVFSSEFPMLHFYLEDKAQPIRELDQRLTAILAEVIQHGIDNKEFQELDPQQLAHILRGMVRAVALRKLVEGQPESLLQTLPLMNRLLFAGLKRLPASLTGEVT